MTFREQVCEDCDTIYTNLRWVPMYCPACGGRIVKEYLP
jgi:rRNA maturation endonuclease Nob1